MSGIVTIDQATETEIIIGSLAKDFSFRNAFEVL